VEFKRLTIDEAKKITVGTKLNAGGGNIFTVTGFTQSKFKYTDKDHLEGYYPRLIICEDKFGESHEWRESVLTQFTRETLDETVSSCKYCGKIRPAEELRSRVIYVNHKQENHQFCKDDSCGIYYQMGCEG
jgi:hypothetical protein